jgi:hypothetical protein
MIELLSYPRPTRVRKWAKHIGATWEKVIDQWGRRPNKAQHERFKVERYLHRTFTTMAAYTYKNDLLAPFLALPQGDKIQAECRSPFVIHLPTHPVSLRCLD